jgi:CDP-diacylglycerol--glycerol-3-phosphate 3-phosphatidyltransferase
VSTPARRWSALHHDIDPQRVPLLLPYLRAMWWLARPLRRVPPTAITVVGVGLAAAAVGLAADAPGAAVVLVFAAGLCDSLDGAVAVLGGTASHSGAIADAVADRVTDVAFAAVLWRCGAPWPLALACAASAVGVDCLRRVRHVPWRITVGERPTWTIDAALACLVHAVADARWPVVVCAAVWLAAGGTALAQLLTTTRPER